VLALEHGDGVGQDARGVIASLRESRRATEGQADIGERGLREADVAREAVDDAD